MAKNPNAAIHALLYSDGTWGGLADGPPHCEGQMR